MESKDQIKGIIEEFLRKMGVSFETVLIEENETGSDPAFTIKSPESGILIGTRGAHISALNHLIKRIVLKQLSLPEGSLRFYIDVNDYHDRLTAEIRNKANILAERARSFKASVEMEPMSSYERMIIHTHFQNSSDIKTESMGVGPKRHVVLRYVEGEKIQ